MKILIIGYGSIAKKHLKAFQSLGESIDYFALRSAENHKECDEIESIYSWDNIPQDIDLAIISNPTQLHTDSLKECVMRGLSIMIEKPISNSLEYLPEIIEQIEEREIKNYVACNLRFLPILNFVRNTVKNKQFRVNEVNVYCGSDLRNWRPGTDYRQSYSSNESLGGGVQFDLFHELDYLVWIFGIPKLWKGINRSVSSLAINAADFAQYQLFYSEFSATVTLNYYRKETKRTFELLFDHDTWMVDLLRGTIVNSAGDLVFSTDFGISNTYQMQARHVFDIVMKNEQSINTINESLKTLKICLSNEKIN